MDRRGIVKKLSELLVAMVTVVGFSAMAYPDLTAEGATYYIANAGNDNCNGLSSTIGTSGNCAWQTITHVNARTFNPGDSILFNKGDTWRGQTFIVPSSGSSGSPIVTGSYGSGNAPILDPSIPVMDTSITITNLALYSQQPATTSNPGWASGTKVGYGYLHNATRANEVTLSPIGDMTGAKITWAGGDLSVASNHVTGLLPNKTYSFSVWVRAGTTANVQGFVLQGHSGTYVSQLWWPTTITSSWQRISGTFTTPASGVNEADVGVAFTTGGNTSLNFYLWGLQVEAGAYIHNYIATTSTSVSGPIAWISNGDGTYSTPNFPNVYIAFEDGIPLKPATSASCANGNFYIGAGSAHVFYYKPTSGLPTSHTVDATKFSSLPYGCGIYSQDKSYITIQNLNIKKAVYGIYSSSSTAPFSNIIVQNNTISECSRGVQFQIPYNQYGSHLQVLYNAMSYLGLSLNFGQPSPEGQGTDTYYTDNTIQGNTIDNNGNASSSLTWVQATYPSDVETISGQDLSNTVVKENVITNGHGYGIFFYSTNGGTAPTANNTITQNYVTTDSAGILFEANTGSAGTQNNTVSYNILNKCGGASPEVAAAFFLMGSAANPATGMNYFVNNTIYAGNTSGMLILQNDLGYWTFENNIIYGTGSHWYMAQSGGASHYVIDYNLYPTGTLDAFYDTGNPQTFTSWQAIGFDLHSPTPANIRFVNSSGSYSLPSDFKLQSTSPARGVGVNVGFTLDYAGNIVSAPPDIGASEYVGKDKMDTTTR